MTAVKPTNDELAGKDYPHRNWLRTEGWRDKLQERATHKALDIADNEMDFNQKIDRSQNGLGWKELAVAAAAVLGGIGLVSHFNAKQDQTPPPQASPSDTEYEVRFYDVNGQPIHVPHISERE